jgi:hypothetical protein
MPISQPFLNRFKEVLYSQPEQEPRQLRLSHIQRHGAEPASLSRGGCTASWFGGP